MSLVLKKVLDIIMIQKRGIYNIYIMDENKNINYAFPPFAVNIISSIILIIYSIKYLNLKDFKNLNPYFIIVIGICITITSCITYKIIKITPNPAYIRIFSAIDMIVILLITCMMLIGFVLISLGVMILTYY